MKKYENWNIGGGIVKQDDRYVVSDNIILKNLVVSSTLLHPNKSTTGHKHEGQEEVYIFIQGNGKMEVGYETTDVKAGDTVLIPDGAFHRVHSGDKGCYFICVFDGNRINKK